MIEAPVVNAQPSVTLPPFGFGVDNHRSLKDILRYSAGSFAGHSAVSGWLACPERSRLGSMGVKMKPSNFGGGSIPDLDPASFGTLNHALRAERLLYGSDSVYSLLDVWARELSYDDYVKAKLMWRIYDSQFPLSTDGWEYLGVETEVRTKLRTWQGQEIVRSVRYDTLIRMGGLVYSFECKTMSKSGRGALLAYMSQAMTQTALWNANEALVTKYGPMEGVIFDMMVKTQNPNVERSSPEVFSKHQQKFILQYLRAPEETVKFFINPETGRYPQFAHSCWGKWSPCSYIPLCHEEAYGMFEYRDGREYDGR